MPANGDSRRAVLSRSIPLIRFPLMKIDEFALHVGKQHYFYILSTFLQKKTLNYYFRAQPHSLGS